MMKRLGFALCLFSGAALAQLLPSGGSSTNITQVGGANITLGQKSTANSFPIALASDATLAVTLGANQSVNVAQVNGVTTLMGNGVTGTGSQRVTIASDNTAFHTIIDSGSTTAVTGTVGVTESGTWTVQPGNTANTTAWLVNSIPKTACGNTAYSTAWAIIPNSNTAPTATTTCLKSMTFTNTTGTAATIAVTDGQGTPVTIVATYSIPANSTAIFPMYEQVATTGIKWVAGTLNAITGAANGWQ